VLAGALWQAVGPAVTFAVGSVFAASAAIGLLMGSFGTRRPQQRF
jgi:hypothetical protein